MAQRSGGSRRGDAPLGALLIDVSASLRVTDGARVRAHFLNVVLLTLAILGPVCAGHVVVVAQAPSVDQRGESEGEQNAHDDAPQWVPTKGCLHTPRRRTRRPGWQAVRSQARSTNRTVYPVPVDYRYGPVLRTVPYVNQCVRTGGGTPQNDSIVSPMNISISYSAKPADLFVALYCSLMCDALMSVRTARPCTAEASRAYAPSAHSTVSITRYWVHSIGDGASSWFLAALLLVPTGLGRLRAAVLCRTCP